MEIVQISDQVMGIIKESSDPAALPGYSPFEMIPAMSAGVTLKEGEGSDEDDIVMDSNDGGDQEQVSWHLEIGSKLSKKQHLALFMDEAPAQSGFEDKGGGFSHWGRHGKGYDKQGKTWLCATSHFPVDMAKVCPPIFSPWESKNFNPTHY